MRTLLILALVVMATMLAGAMLAPVQARPDPRERETSTERRVEQHERRDDRHERSRRQESRKGVLTRNEAARRAQRQYGGRVLSVDLLQSEDAPARYRVKLLFNGNVRTVDIKALED